MIANNTERKNDAVCNEGILANGYGLAPRMVMRDKRLSIEAKAIYCYLQSLAGSSGKAFPKRETIISDLGISKDRFYKHMKQLMGLDYIRLTKSDKNSELRGRNIYLIVSCPGTIDEPETEPEKKVEKKNKAEKIQRTDIKDPDNIYEAAIDISQLCEKYPEYRSNIELIGKVISDMAMSDSVTISGSVKSHEAVIKVLSQFEEKHLLYVLNTLISHKKTIKNKRAWIQACIFNSIFEEDDELKKCKTSLEKGKSLKEKTAPGAEKEADTVTDEYIEEKKREINSAFCKHSLANFRGDSESVEKYKKLIEKLENELKEYISKLPDGDVFVCQA